MRKPLIGIILAVLFLMEGCTQHTEGIIDIKAAIRNTVILSGEDMSQVIGTDPSMLMLLEKTPSFYISSRLPATDTLLLDIRDAEGKILQRFARKGNGPTEYLAPFVKDVEEKKGSLSFNVLEIERCRWDSYQYDSKENNVELVSSRDLPQKITPIGQLLRTNKGYFGVVDNLGSDIFTMDEKMENIQFFSYEDSQERTLQESLLFHTASCSSPDGKRVAMAFVNLPRIDFFSSDGKTERVCYYGKRMEVSEASSRERYFGYVRCDSNFLYVKYYAEANRKLLLKMRWDGEIVKVFDMGLDLISFNIQNGFLFGLAVSPDSGEEVYVRYDIS